MAYNEASAVQFLDLSGVDEDEKLRILSSLQTRDSTVKGPWGKTYTNQQSIVLQQVCHTQENHILQKKYDHYPAPAVIIPTAVYAPPPFQTPPVFPPAFAPQVQYQPPIVAVNQVLPVVSSIVPAMVLNNQYPYPTYPVPMNNAYSGPMAANCINQPYINNTEMQQDVVIPIPEDDEKVECNGGAVVKDEPEVKLDEAGKSWASLFNKNKSGEVHRSANEEENKPLAMVSPFVQNNIARPDEIKSVNKSLLAQYNDPNYYQMGETLVNYPVDHRITSLQPRGLINHSNYCYINSILQAMLACPPFYNLLNNLSESVKVKEGRKHTQMIDNMVHFVNEFKHLPPGQRVTRRSDPKGPNKKEQHVSVNCDKPFEPFWIYKMLSGIRSDSFVVEGRQEDAEEFLGCLLNGLNDEMLELMKLVEDASPAPPQLQPYEDVERAGDGDNWQVIGPKNKGCVTRRTEIIRTPISDIFGGHIRSRLHRTGDQITDNIQPFFTLQLNIEKVNTVREALEALVCKNQLEGVTSSKTNEEVEAWQQVTIEELPVVLILHLKCFDFKLDGCTKIIKALEFPVDLKVETKLLSSKNNYQSKEKQYKLFAVVYHDGKEATKGHYLTDAYHVGYASWIRYDDAAVKAVQEEHVLKPQGTRVPYLLFYRRCDTVRSK